MRVVRILLLAEMLLALTATPVSAQAPVAVVNGASFAPGAPVAPGSLASAFALFGTDAGDALSLPLPRELAGVQVFVNDVASPLIAVRAGQINFQVPFGAIAGTATLRVMRGAVTLGTGTFPVAMSGPGLFVVPGDLTQPGAVLNQDYRLNTELVPARAGAVVQIFATGQGSTDPPAQDGLAGGLQPLCVTPKPPRVFFGDQQGEVLFSGLSPQFAGLWQINARVPQISGQVPVFVVLGGSPSNAITIWVSP